MPNKILVIGLNPVWQRVILLTELNIGEVNRASNVLHCGSGKGLNYSKALKALGGNPLLAGFAGGDRGVKFIKDINKWEIESIYEQTESVTRSCTTLISEKPHAVTEVIDPSPLVTPKEVDSLLKKIREEYDECGAVVISGTHPQGMDMSFYKEVLKDFQNKFSLLDVYINAQEALEVGVSMLKINKRELLELSKEKYMDDAAQKILSNYSVQYLGITDGPDEACLYTSEGKTNYRIPPVSVLNPIGAGDCVGAGTVMKFHVLKQDMQDAFQYGLACGMASCERNIPSEFDVERVEECNRLIQRF